MPNKCGDCCRQNFMIKTGKIMHTSKLPACKWVMTIYHVLTTRKGISSLRLSKESGIAQKSACHMLRRIRETYDNTECMLAGIIEIDERYINGKEVNKHERRKPRAGRGSIGKQLVIGIRKHGVQTKAKLIKSTAMETLRKKIGESVKFGAKIYTDDHPSYDHLYTAYNDGVAKHSTEEFINKIAHTNVELRACGRY